MWWKLGLLALVTVILVLSIIPIRTHAVAADPSGQAPRASVFEIVGAMHFTPVTVGFIAVILTVAGFVAARIVRRRP